MKVRTINLILIFLFAIQYQLSYATEKDTLYLSLDEAIRLAQKHSLEAIEARLNRKGGLISLLNNSSQILPSISLSASHEKQKTQFSTTSSYSKTLNITQPVFNAEIFGNLYKGKLYYYYYQAQADDKKTLLAYNVKLTYYNLCKTYNLYENAQAALKRAQENYRFIKEKYNLGLVTDFEVLQSESFLSQAELEMWNTQKNLEIQETELKQLIGISDKIFIRPQTIPDPPSEELDFNKIWDLIINYNCSLTASKIHQKTALLTYIQAICNIFPNISYYRTRSYYDTSLTPIISDWQNYDVVNWGLKIHFPISDFKTYLLALINARHEYQRAKLQRKNVEQSLYKTFITVFQNYQESRIRLSYILKNLALNQKLLKLAEEQYRLGLISQLDLLNAEINFNRAQADYYNTLYDVYLNYAQIEYLVGKISKP
ncbi:MAG: TolC family protein [candidate division WOR-3 bacterium]